VESTKAGGFKMRQYLKQYESMLIDQDLVRENQVPYMIEWVHQFLSPGQLAEVAKVIKTGLQHWKENTRKPG